MLAPGTFIHQRYRITQHIASGGAGAVYQALDEHLRREVALKQSHARGSPAHARAFAQEAHILARLEHPALPRVSDYFVEGESHFLVMQFIDGPDLATLLQRRDAPFAHSDVLRWADELLDALIYLHNQRSPVIHRDIKPLNLKLNEHGEIRLLDFGLAKGATDGYDGRAASSIHGYTKEYAPFEQIEGTGTDPRSDLYSLAATLYHLLVNQPPPNALTRSRAVLNDEPDPLRRADLVNPLVPASLAAVLAQALSLRPVQRPQSAAALRAALRAALPSSVISVPPPEPPPIPPPVTPGELVIHTPAIETVQMVATPVPVHHAPARRRRSRLLHFVAAALLIMLMALVAPVLSLAAPVVAPLAVLLLLIAVVAGVAFVVPAILPGATERVIGSHGGGVLHVIFVEQGRQVASAGDDGTLSLWDIKRAELVRTHRAHTGEVRALLALADGRTMATAGEDALVRLWRTADGVALRTMRGHGAGLRTLANSPDGQILASAGYDGAVRLWRVSDGALLHVLPGHPGCVWRVMFAPDGKTLVSAGDDTSMRVWRLLDGQLLYLLDGHNDMVNDVTFSKDGAYLATASDDTTLRVWRASDGALLHTLRGHKKGVNGVQFSPDGQWLASRGADLTVRLWRVSNGQLRWTATRHTQYISSLAFDPRSQAVITSAWDASVCMFDVRNGKAQRLGGHALPIRDMALSPDGRMLASGGADRTVRLWRLRR